MGPAFFLRASALFVANENPASPLLPLRESLSLNGMSAPPLVEFRAVTKRFGDGPVVLDHIDLAAQSGDFVSLIGPSGCGKSTLLRLIAGLSPVSSGTLSVGGRSPDAAGADLAFVFQEPTLLPWLTVEKNVELPQK